MKKVLIILLVSIFLVAPTSALCTLTLDKTEYSPTETASAEITCSENTERLDSYTVNWTFQNGTEVELDTGTTPNSINENFYEAYTIPSTWPVGTFLNATLQGADLDGATDSANVTSPGSGSVLITDGIFGGGYLGLVGSIRATVKDSSQKKISGGFCRVSVWSNDETKMIIGEETNIVDGEVKISEILSPTRFNEETDYAYKILCYCGSDGSNTECINEDGATVEDSAGSMKDFFTTSRWIEVNTITNEDSYVMKNEIIVCANVTNSNYPNSIPLNIYNQVRCSAGTDSNDDLDRTLIADDGVEPDRRIIKTNTTQTQCKRFNIPELKYLQGRTSECYASTNVWILDNSNKEIIGYSTVSPSFTLTSTELNINPDWVQTSGYNWNTIVNLSEKSFSDINGNGTGNIDLKLNTIETTIKSSDQYDKGPLSIENFILTQHIKSITAKNLTGHDIEYNFEVLDDGSIEIELRNTDISQSGWVNVSLEFNQFYERQAAALEGIENKTGTFHLDVQCPSEISLGEDMECSITAQVEDDQTSQKEVDFTCYIAKNNIKYSSVNFNQMVEKTPITLQQTFPIPQSLEEGSEYTLQCHADYYNFGSRRDSFYDTFSISGGENTVSSGGYSPTNKDGGQNTIPITGEAVKNPLDEEENNTYIITTTIAALAILLISIILLSYRKNEHHYHHKTRRSRAKGTLKKKDVLTITIGSLIGLTALLLLGKYLIYIISKGYNLFLTANVIEDPLFRGMLLVTFIALVTVIVFKLLEIKVDISIGKKNPIEKYWKNKTKN